MSTDENNENEMPNNKLDAIKEIIFGENIKAYDSEFKQLKDELKSQGDAIEQEISEVKNDFAEARKELDKQINDLRKEIGKLNEIKSDKKTLAKLLRTVADKLES